MFSTTTIASSTTSPIASTIASSVSRFTEKPIHSISESTPISDRGIVTTGTITERSEPRNRKMIRITIRLASTSVLTTSSIDSRMVLVPSKTTSPRMPSGSWLTMSGIIACTLRPTSSGFAVIAALMPTKTATRPSWLTRES